MPICRNRERGFLLWSGRDLQQITDSRAEKEDDLAARKRIKEQIEADKRERAAKAAREKALREGRNPDLPESGAAPAAAAAPSAAGTGSSSSGEKKTYDSARLQIRVPSGPPLVHTLPASATLGELADWVKQQSGLASVTLTCSFPR